MEFFSQMLRPNGLVARQLPALFLDPGLSDLRTDIVAMLQQRFDATPFGNWLIDSALEKPVIEEDASTAEKAFWTGFRSFSLNRLTIYLK